MERVRILTNLRSCQVQVPEDFDELLLNNQVRIL